jgi:hypothetical protein
MKRILLAMFALLATTAAQSQTAIDSAKAVAGNVTPGDAPWYPVTISKSGAYVLTGNLDVPLNVPGIVIEADDVTLDLGGFMVASMTSCEQDGQGYVICNQLHNATNKAAFSGIRILGRNVVVRNGTVKGFRGHGIYANKGAVWLDGLSVHSNRHNGVHLHTALNYRVTRSNLFLNADNGLWGVSVLIDGVIARSNGDHGIEVSHGTVVNTVATMNRYSGLVGAGGPNPTSVRHSQFQFNRGAQEVQGDLVSGGGNVANATVF